MPAGFTPEQQEQIREELFIKGIQLIRELGVQRTTVDRLTRECGIAKGSFYLFYDSKEAYLAALGAYTEGKLREMLQRHLAGRPQMTTREFYAFLKEWLYSDYDVMSHLTLEDFLWIRSHMADQNYFDPNAQQPVVTQCLALVSDARIGIDPGTIVNLLKCIYAMREHRDTMVAASIDDSIDLILQTLVAYVSGEALTC